MCVRARYASFLRFPNVAKSFCGNDLRPIKSVHFGPEILLHQTAHARADMARFLVPPTFGRLAREKKCNRRQKTAFKPLRGKELRR